MAFEGSALKGHNLEPVPGQPREVKILISVPCLQGCSPMATWGPIWSLGGPEKMTTDGALFILALALIGQILTGLQPEPAKLEKTYDMARRVFCSTTFA